MKKIFIIDGPSGCGKTTVALELEKLSSNIKYICSCTKRKKRPEEVDGREHFFLEEDEFDRKRKNGELMGWYNMYFTEYGIDVEKVLSTPQENIIITYHSEEGTLKEDIRRQGIEFTTILILPDNADVLRSRIVGRDPSLAEEKIVNRLEKYKFLLSLQDKYDFVFMNREGKLAETVANVFEVIKNR